MWVLKEPYDDFDDEGNPKGGGWSMTDGFIENDKIKEEAKKNKFMETYGLHDLWYQNKMSL